MELQDYPNDFSFLSESEKLAINHKVFESTLRHRAAISRELNSVVEELKYTRIALSCLQADLDYCLQGLGHALIGKP